MKDPVVLFGLRNILLPFITGVAVSNGDWALASVMGGFWVLALHLEALR
jgi:hypothetical protein